jgi:hypothetical protein
LSAGSKFSETREVAGIFIGNNRNYKREGQNGGHQQFPVAPEYEVLSWIAHLVFLFTVAQRICLAERWLFPSELPKREYIPIVESVLFLTVMTGHYRLARLRISLLASTRIRRDRNPSPGLMAHCPKVKFARDRFSKLLYMCGFRHDASPLERTIAYQRLRSLALKRKRVALNSQCCRQHTVKNTYEPSTALAESVGMKIYYLVPLHPLERKKPRGSRTRLA